MRRLIVIFLIIFSIFFILPAAVVMVYAGTGNHTLYHVGAKTQSKANRASTKTATEEPVVSVYRSQLKKVEKVPMESYVIGVVASEMPATFHLEALKAQALAARTYVLRQITEGQPSSLPDQAMVTDTTVNQVYQNVNQLKKEWGASFQQKYAKVEKAVQETSGQVITYKGQLITPSFFSTSNGYTENAQDYWENAVPYLKSVPSPWDQNSPKFLRKTTLPVTKVDSLLQINLPNQNGTVGYVIAYTQSHRVATFKIGGKTFSGRDIREKLGLPSTDFTMTEKGSNIVIQTKGFGHGVGMSQYGADALAGMGKSYKDIITYYYRGTKITQWTQDHGTPVVAMKK